MHSDQTVTPAIPRWQLVLILIAFPALYILNSLMPWSIGLFVDGDRYYYPHFVISTLSLHWLSTALTIYVTRKNGHTLADYGLSVSPRSAVLIVAVLVLLGLAIIFFRQLVPYAGEAADREDLIPINLSERLMWLATALSAGFCEELIYRGFGINVLRWQGLRTWQAVILATLSFVFIHGIAAVFAFPAYFVVGLGFAALYLWRNNLLPVMLVHALIDMSALLAP